jgi:alpha-amylase
MDMMIYLASAFFSPGGDPRSNRVSVPSPMDRSTPDVDWWWDKQAKDFRRRRHLGYSHALIPPVCKTSAGDGPMATGYGLDDHHDLGSKKYPSGVVPTRFGTRAQLQRMIAIAHANDTGIIADLVLHQMSGGRAGFYRYPGAPTDAHPNGVPNVGRFPKQPGCFRSASLNQPIPPWRPEDDVPSPADDFPFGDQCSYGKSIPPRYMIEGVKRWIDWKVTSLDIDGFRLDDTKGLWAPWVNEFRSSGAVRGLWGFNEYFDGRIDVDEKARTLGWYSATQIKGSMSQLDFPFHWSSQDVCDNGHTMWRWMPGNSFADFFPFLSVLFVDSPDTDLSPNQQIISNKLLAYARMFLISPGVPMTYYRDDSSDVGCYGLGLAGIENLAWCRSRLIGGAKVVRHIDNDVIGVESLGYQVKKPGALCYISRNPLDKREMFGPTAFGPNVHLHEYSGCNSEQGLPEDVWTDGNGWARTKVPSNEFGKARSYTCWAPAGVKDGGEPTPRATTVVFYGGVDVDGNPDIDIAPAYNGHRLVSPNPGAEGTVWCAAGTTISAWIDISLPPGGEMAIVVRNKTDGELGRFPIENARAPGFQNIFQDKSVLRDGWISVLTDSAGLPEPRGTEYALKIKHTGTTGLSS